jgi:hypothetical protein
MTDILSRNGRRIWREKLATCRKCKLDCESCLSIKRGDVVDMKHVHNCNSHPVSIDEFKDVFWERWRAKDKNQSGCKSRSYGENPLVKKER